MVGHGKDDDMTQFGFFPSDDRIAQALGLVDGWAALQPYAWLFGYPLWLSVAAFFFALEMLFPRYRTSWILAGALLTGVTVKLGQVYEWGRFSLGEQIVLFVLFSAICLIWRNRIAFPSRRTA
jgi:hypothetical protein